VNEGQGSEAQILRGGPVAKRVEADLAEKVSEAKQRGRRPPGLGVLMVGDNPASDVYVGRKVKACARVGMTSRVVRLPATADTPAVLAAVAALNEDPDIDAFIVQMPLPAAVNTDVVLSAVRPEKDADGLHPTNLGRLVVGQPAPVPCTPKGVMRLLAHYGVSVAGRRATVVGRSRLVGWPMAVLLTHAQATVTLAHSRTPDLAGVCREAEILVVAAGRPGLVGLEHVAPGAVVVDVGLTRTPEGLSGDVRFDEVARQAAALTPVPGGVGPLTVAMLLHNAWEAYAREQ
jgi:methylenetetrahydrofolate dehydrogenase (NADP+)/methenyltetrahydrofolate cyclohydrolase